MPQVRSWGPLVIAFVLFTLAADAHAEMHTRKEDTDSFGFVVSPGAMMAWAGSKGLRFDGELSGTVYGRSFGLGIATGGNPTRFYAELQPVGVFDLAQSKDSEVGLLVGLNPGVVVDWSGPTTRTGGQVTAWSAFMWACCHGALPIPFVPFARLEVFRGEYVASVGLMLKLGFPVGAATHG